MGKKPTKAELDALPVMATAFALFPDPDELTIGPMTLRGHFSGTLDAPEKSALLSAACQCLSAVPPPGGLYHKILHEGVPEGVEAWYRLPLKHMNPLQALTVWLGLVMSGAVLGERDAGRREGALTKAANLCCEAIARVDASVLYVPPGEAGPTGPGLKKDRVPWVPLLVVELARAAHFNDTKMNRLGVSMAKAIRAISSVAVSIRRRL